MKKHFTHPYLVNPPHKITIELVGLGGTGSQVLTSLARMNEALIASGHPGLHVRAWDHDDVSIANLGRQLFSQSDLGMNKAIVLITRVNRFFGYEWQAMAEKYNGSNTGNIIITCIDTAAGRVELADKITFKEFPQKMPIVDRPYYWLDIGNLQKTGQVVLGSLTTIKQPKGHDSRGSLRVVTKLFPQMKRIKEEDQGPSCSLAEALTKQDLFINSTLAQFGCNILWKLLRDGLITYQGCYVNLETLSVNPINI